MCSYQRCTKYVFGQLSQHLTTAKAESHHKINFIDTLKNLKMCQNLMITMLLVLVVIF